MKLCRGFPAFLFGGEVMSLTGFNRMRRRLAAEKEKEVNYEEKIKNYHIGGGWYDIPGFDNNLRKDDAIAVLKESDK
jgi:hypothetical protein